MNISDMIEEFIKETLGDSEKLDISRNELASYFNVAPSQINYVLTTRFNYERGFVTESKRGGNGYVTILRTDDNDSKWVKEILARLSNDLDYRSGVYLLTELCERELIDIGQCEVLKSAISPPALANPFRLENHFRAQILKRVILDAKKQKVKVEE